MAAAQHSGASFGAFAVRAPLSTRGAHRLQQFMREPRGVAACLLHADRDISGLVGATPLQFRQA